MKKRIVLFVLTIAFAATLFAACGGKDTYNNIAAQSNPYSMGTQSIVITASSANAGEPTAKFKSGISPADIELGQALAGKKVTKVVYNGESSITVTLEGNTTSAGGDGVYGTITVKQSGMASKGNSTCTVNVRAPELRVANYSYSFKTKDGVTLYGIRAKLDLAAGTFTDAATAENVCLEAGVSGELSVQLSDGILIITVKNCDKKNPSVCLKSAATSFGKEITVTLAVASFVKI